MPKSKKKSPTPAHAPARSTPASPRPWIVDGVDYGPAINAVADLAAWAFELAAKDVEEWPEGRRRVRSARRAVLSRLRGKYIRYASSDDVLFTAGLLARIFDADLALGMSEMVTILDELGLPTEVVPLMPRRHPGRRNASNVLAFPSRRPGPEEAPPPCASCIHEPRFRSAA